MNFPEWMEFLWAEDSLYFFVGSAVSFLLAVLEMFLLRLREKTILGHLGWKDRDLDDESSACD